LFITVLATLAGLAIHDNLADLATPLDEHAVVAITSGLNINGTSILAGAAAGLVRTDPGSLLFGALTLALALAATLLRISAGRQRSGASQGCDGKDKTDGSAGHGVRSRRACLNRG
jgi:hypothetical protein